MPNTPRHLIIISVTALSLLGCATNQKTGALIGAAAGAAAAALIENDALVITAGAVIGGVIGNRIGARMDRRDKQRTAQVLEHNAAHQSSAWTNPETGHQFQLTPRDTYQTDSGPCRGFELMATIDDEQELMQGTGCRQPDGSWVTS